MKKQQILAIFLLTVLLTGLFSTTAFAETEEEQPFEEITVSAKAALLVDGETGQVLLAQDAHKELPPASITKCMTTLLVLKAIESGRLHLDDEITASQTAINLLTEDSSSANIKVGEKMTVEQLLYCVMVQSANEACYILAEAVSGSVDAFVAEMNAEAKRLGCENTHFINPCGLHDPEHYTSAWDIYLITKEAMKYSLFTTLAGTREYTLPPTNLSDKRVFHTTNSLMDSWRATGYLYSYARGVKTGHTSDAGYCLVSYAEKGGRSLYSVVLGAQKREDKIESFSETKRMFEWGFSSFRRTTVLEKTAPVAQVSVTLSRKTNYVALRPSEEVTVLLPCDVKPEDLKQEITLNAESVEAPITEGQPLGLITVSDSDGTVYATADLLALNDVPASQLLVAQHKVAVFFSHPIVKILAAVLAILIALGIIRHLRRRPKRYRGGQSYRTRRRDRRYHGKKR